MPTSDEIIINMAAIVNKKIVHFRRAESIIEMKCFLIMEHYFYIKLHPGKAKTNLILSFRESSLNHTKEIIFYPYKHSFEIFYLRQSQYQISNGEEFKCDSFDIIQLVKAQIFNF